MKQRKDFLIFSVLLIMGSIGLVNMAGKQSPQVRKIKKIPAVHSTRLIKPLKIFKNTLIGPLLETKWSQKDEYARFAPKIKTKSKLRFRLGCWSTALAQILYYHRLQPVGKVSYDTSSSCTNKNVCHISESLGYNFIWSKFVDTIGPNTSLYKKIEVARYCYYTAVVVQKDFGTGYYRLTHSQRAEAVATYYEAATSLYSTEQGDSLNEIKQIILEEINKARPLMMHLRSVEQKAYHAVVIDGAGYIGQRFIIHINMGQKGKNNGWYNFEHIDDTYNDDHYRKIIKIKPLIRRRVMEKLLLKAPSKYLLSRGEIIYYFPTSRGGWDSRVGKPPHIRVSNLPRSLGETVLKSK